MLLTDLIVAAQLQADEVLTNPDLLWTEAEWTQWANEAESEACLRAGLLIDQSSSITSVSVIAGTATYTLDEKIIMILRAKLSTGTEPLVKTSRKVLDATYSNWEADTGTVRSWFPDDTNKITLYKSPIVNSTLSLMISRHPLLPMLLADKLTVSPEIDTQYHLGLVDWMLHKAYSKQDSETLDKGKAKEHLARFTLRFGERPPAGIIKT